MPDSCPDSIPNYDYLGTFEDHKYFLSHETTTWGNARDKAIILGGYLTSITSLEESEFIVSNLVPFQQIAFIGLNDEAMEGNLVWSNGEALSFYNLTSSNGPAQDYATISPWTGEWSLDGMWTPRKYIVEIPCNEVSENGSLVITNVECPEQFPYANNVLSFNVTVKNTDTIPSLESEFGVYQDISNINTSIVDDLLGSAIVPALEPDDFTTFTIYATISDPFYFPGFTMGDNQWNDFYVKRFFNPTGLSLESDQGAYDVAIYCQTYDADIQISLTTNSTTYGDSAYFQYFVEILNAGPDTAYNIKAELAKIELGNIPSLAVEPDIHQTVTTEIDSVLTKLICIDSLNVGEKVRINVFNDFDNDINSPDTIPPDYTVSVEVYSEHLIDPQPWNNAQQMQFIFDPNFSDDCPLSLPGFQILGQYNQNRYFLSDGKFTWEEAKIIAEENNGYLACFETYAESEFVMNLIDENAFIGISDREVEGELQWVNGEALLYDNVQNANGPNLDYGSINFWDGLWVLNKLVVEMKFILEIPCSFEPGTFPNLTAANFKIEGIDTLANGMYEFEQEGSYDYSFILNNDGTQDAANEYLVELFLSTDDSLSTDDFSVGSFVTGFTGVMQYDSVDIEPGIFIPWDFVLGDYYLLLKVDTNDEIEELNEDDNVIVHGQKITVTGNLCTSGPVAEDGDVTVYGIPQGNTIFALYNASYELIHYQSCSNDCESSIFIPQLPDGDYFSFVYHYDENWENLICHLRIDFEIVLGNSNIIDTENDSPDQQFMEKAMQLMQSTPVITQQLYPNPANDHLFTNIFSAHDFSDVTFEIYDINGKLVLSKASSIYEGSQTVEVDISTLSIGLHHITVRDKENVLSNSRFIKH